MLLRDAVRHVRMCCWGGVCVLLFFVRFFANACSPHYYIFSKGPQDFMKQEAVRAATSFMVRLEMGSQPLQHLLLQLRRAEERYIIYTVLQVAWTSVLPGPPEHMKMSSGSGPRANLSIPRAAVLPRPPQHMQMSFQSGHLTYLFIRGTPIGHRPLEYIEIAMP